MNNDIYNFSNSGINKLIEQMQQISRPVVDMVNSTVFRTSMQSVIQQCSIYNKMMQEYFISDTFQKVLKPTIQSYIQQINNIRSQIIIPNIYNTILSYKDVVSEIDFNNLKINDNGTIEYEGETFYEEDIDKATKEIATSSSISKVKKQSILQKIILFILSAYICGIIGQAGAETYTYLKDRFLGIYEDVQSSNNEDNYFNEKCRIVDVTELNVRESYSRISKIIGKLYYLQLVKELEKVPYWTKIEYIDIENDIKIIGWVSTRCIKSYNQFKSKFNDIEE